MSGFIKLGSILIPAGVLLLVSTTFMPPAMDYPNHLVRIWLLSGHWSDPALREFYRPDWLQSSTNIGGDFLAASVSRVFPIFLVSKLLVVILFFGPPLGAAILNYRIFRRYGAWIVLFLIFSWTTTSVAGFFGFQLSLTCAFVGAALWLGIHARASKAIQILYHALASILVLAIHPFGLLLYLALVLGTLIGPTPVADARRGGLIERLPLAAICILVSVTVVVLMFLIAPHPPGGSTGIAWYPSFAAKLTLKEILRTFGSTLLSYDTGIDTVFFVSLAAAIGYIAYTIKFEVHWGLAIASVGLGLLAVVMPSAVGDASWLERRVPIMAALTFMAALHPKHDEGPAGILAGIGMLAIVVARVGWIATVWHARDADARELVAMARTIPAGSKVLLVRTSDDHRSLAPPGRLVAGNPYHAPEMTSRHLGTLLVVTDRVFVPTLFSIPGQHAIAVRPSYRRLSVTASTTPKTSVLGTPDKRDPYVRNWRCDFDYAVVMNLDGTRPSARYLAQVSPIVIGRFAEVDRIDRPSRCAFRRAG